MDNRSIAQYPASTRVVETIRRRIADGSYRGGAWLPTERDLATELAVSRPVIRAALSELAEQGIVVRQRGCRPRVSAAVPELGNESIPRDGATVGAYTIDAIIPQCPTYVSAHAILRGISQRLRSSDVTHRLAVFDTHTDTISAATRDGGHSREQIVLEGIERGSVAGIIIWHHAGAETLPILRRIEARGTPIVYVDRCPSDLDEDYECDYVGVDNRSAARDATNYLLDLGHRRIGFLTIDDRSTAVIERAEGMRDAMRGRGIPVPADLVYTSRGDIDLDMARAARFLASLDEPPTAVVALNDLHAFAFIRAAEKRGLRVPDDISVMGFDDIEAYSPHSPILTTVHQPFYAIGERAADLLLRRLNSRQSAAATARRHILLPTSLVVRSTCRSL